MTKSFDENELKANLEKLNLSKRVAFAASCSERLYPGYLAYSKIEGEGNAVAFRRILDQIWETLVIGDDPSKLNSLDGDIVTVEGLLIEDEDEEKSSVEINAAEDAIATLCYTLLCAKNDSIQDPAWAARRAYEACDQYVLSLDPGTSFDEEAILENPLIQRELDIQTRVIDTLNSANVDFAEVRKEAVAASSTFLPWFANYL